MPTILEAIDVHKSYPIGKKNQRVVLANINLKVEKQEFVSIMGPSGSGKSTLLYSLSSMDKITSGNLIFENQELTEYSEKQVSQLRLNKMGFIFQQIHLLKNLSLFDNVIFSAFLARKFSREEIRRRALLLMKIMGIENLLNNDVTEASGGQLQRVAICRSLINDPTILFGDEPTGALDSKTANDITDLLNSINVLGTTILLVTHDIKVASKSERVIYILDGEIVAEKKLGKYTPSSDNIVEREKQLADWLMNVV